MRMRESSVTVVRADTTAKALRTDASHAPGVDDRAPATAADKLRRLHLMALASPALPVGGFAYSQGLERAVDVGLVTTESDAQQWLLGLLEHCQSPLDVPMLARLHAAWTKARACAAPDAETGTPGMPVEIAVLCARLLASRESRELQAEDVAQGQALGRLLRDLGIAGGAGLASDPDTTWAAAFALASVHFDIAVEAAAEGYLFAWVSSQVAAAVRLVPLGQTSGQRLTLRALAAIPEAVARGLALTDAEIGASAPGLACLSAQHETQYTRLFRS